MDIERERGITIKAQTSASSYKAKDGQTYSCNLIDTPGPRRLQLRGLAQPAACEGALLVVDATQGVEAQTLANVYLALENNLEIIPVLNKVDLPSADVDKTKQQIEESSASTARGDRRAARRRASASPRSSRRSSNASRRPRARPTRPCARSSSTPGTTATAARGHGARRRRHAEEGPEGEVHGDRSRVRGHRAGRLHAAPDGARGARPRRGRLHRGNIKTCTTRRSATP
jgi:hypothetical protein